MTPAALTILAMDDNVREAKRLQAEGKMPAIMVQAVVLSRFAFAMVHGEPDAVDRAEWDRLTPQAKRARLEQAKLDIRLPKDPEPLQ
jgi:hypothetical protein